MDETNGAAADVVHQHPVAVDPSHSHGWTAGGQPLVQPAVNDPIGWLTARVEALEARLGPVSEHGQDRTDLALTGLLSQILKVEARLAHVERASGILPPLAAEG